MSRRPISPLDSSDDEQSQLLKDQKDYQAIRDHEQGLDKLGEAIKRQKQMANEIAVEVDVHNEIIDDIDSGLMRTDANVRKNTRNIRLVLKKSSTFYLWLLIVMLAIGIGLLAFL